MARKTPPEIDVVMRMIDEAFERKAWHGTNLRGSLRGVTAKEAAFRPGPKRRNIWEIVVHAAYWKYAVRRRLSGDERGSFPLKGSNWFPRPVEVSEKAWKSDVALLTSEHRAMREVIAAIPPKDLFHTPKGRSVSNVALICGIASHDLYHTGQIQVLKRLARQRSGR